MKTKHLLTAIALPALFAACTAEDVTTAENIVKSDLDNRPVVEDVTFSFGDAQSRANILNYNSITFEEGDKVGVALVDNVVAAGDTDPIKRYALTDNTINTNYIFTADAAGAFSSEAAMVEGNYVFYYPYNTQRTRGQIYTDLPKEQALTLREDGSYTSYPSVLAYSEEKGAPIAVAYDFLSASDAGNTLDATLKQIYATPLITLENTAVKGGTGEDKDTPVAVTIKQIILNGSFTVKAPLNFATAGNTAYQEATGTANSIVSALYDENLPSTSVKKGPWTTSILKRKTVNLIGAAVSNGGTASSIVLTLDKPVTVPANGKFSFYPVIPADAYTSGLTVTVYNAEGKSQDVVLGSATLTAGQRYAEEEFDANEKVNNDVKGVSLTSSVTENFALTGQLVSTVDELINAIRNAEVGSTPTIRMTGDAVINSRVANMLKLTTSTKATSITFVNEVVFDGPSITWAPAVPVIFNENVTVKTAAVVTVDDQAGNTTIAALKKVVNNGTLSYKYGDLTQIDNYSTLNLYGGLNTTTKVNNYSTISTAANGSSVAITTGVIENGNDNTKVAAELNVASGIALNSTVTNRIGAEINNNGIAIVDTNKGTIYNGGENNNTASISIVDNEASSTTYTAEVYNYGTLSVTTHGDNIVMKSINAVASINAGTGVVENDVLGMVTAPTTVDVTYLYENINLSSNNFSAANLTNNKITTVIFKNANFYAYSNVDFNNLKIKTVGNVTINSGAGANAGFKLNNVTSVYVGVGTLTVNKGVAFAAGTSVNSLDSAGRYYVVK